MSIYSHVFINELTALLDDRIIDFANEQFGKSKFFSRNLPDIVEEIVQSEMGDVVGKEALRKLARTKQHNKLMKKRRCYKRCLDAVDTDMKVNDPNNDKYFLRNTLNIYNITPENNRHLVFEGLSLEELEQKKLEEIEEWSLSSETLMIDYPSEERLTASTISSNFKIDLFINILQIVKDLYNYDLGRATYAVMEDLRNQPLFAINKTSAVVDGNSHELTVYKSPSGDKKLVLTFPDEMIDEKGTIRLLDSMDEAILSYLINRWDEKLPSASFHGVPVMDIMDAVAPDKQKSVYFYNDIVKRIGRLYGIGMKGIGKGEQIDEGFHIISGFKHDAATKYIFYSFDNFYLDKYNNLKIRKMSSKPLKTLINNTAKILYPNFMEQRRNAYKQAKERGIFPEEYIIPLEYSYFLYWCNFGDLNKRKNYHNEIIKALDDFKNNQILIKDYEYIANKKIYKITFFALTEDEIKDFDFYYNIKEIPQDTEVEQFNLFLPIIEE